MGICIALDPKAPRGDFNAPLATMLTLTCDGDHGLFPVSEEFRHEDGYIRQYQFAMNAGWKDAQRKSGRVFFCPGCSGKKVRDERSIAVS